MTMYDKMSVLEIAAYFVWSISWNFYLEILGRFWSIPFHKSQYSEVGSTLTTAMTCWVAWSTAASGTWAEAAAGTEDRAFSVVAAHTGETASKLPKESMNAALLGSTQDFSTSRRSSWVRVVNSRSVMQGVCWCFSKNGQKCKIGESIFQLELEAGKLLLESCLN